MLKSKLFVIIFIAIMLGSLILISHMYTALHEAQSNVLGISVKKDIRVGRILMLQ